jgi:hypothetical protein
MASRMTDASDGDSFALVYGPDSRPHPQVRELSLPDAQSALADHKNRKRGGPKNLRVVSDRALDELPRGAGGLAGQGDAATRRAKAERQRKLRADRERQRRGRA